MTIKNWSVTSGNPLRGRSGDAHAATDFGPLLHAQVWFGHRDFCGDNACPFLPPPLNDLEILLARACSLERGILEMRASLHLMKIMCATLKPCADRGLGTRSKAQILRACGAIFPPVTASL